MKTKMKNPKKPLQLSKCLNPKTSTSANPEYVSQMYIYIYIYIIINLLVN